MMNAKTRYSDLPARLRRYRADIYRDKYKRLGWDVPSRTITAHIAKDGYWYIHPEQHRTLTVREAARIQTFPDWFRFSGTRSDSFRQIGEAVPPQLALALGRALLAAATTDTGGPSERSSVVPRPADSGETLSSWYRGLGDAELERPWARVDSPWERILGLYLFDSMTKKEASVLWTAFRSRWPNPDAFLHDIDADGALKAVGQVAKLDALIYVATWLESPDGDLDELRECLGWTESKFEMVLWSFGWLGAIPADAQAVRVAERVLGESANKSRVAAQVLLARLIGNREEVDKRRAIAELGARICVLPEPRCDACPIEQSCTTGIETRPIRLQKPLF